MIQFEKLRHDFKTGIQVEGITFMPGDQQALKIPVGRMPSDTRLYVNASIYRAKEEGPVVLIMGGVHGDEINGIEINNQLLASGYFEKIKKGSIICIPLVNVFGFNNFSRDVPDGKDVNRSFPGSMNGSLAARVARTITKKILPFVDVAMDMHTGGGSRYNYPQTRYTRKDEKAIELAKIFNAPYTIRQSLIPKSFRKTAYEEGVPSIVFEGGESVRLDGLSINAGKRGVLRVLNALDMIEYTSDPEPSIHVTRTAWIRASMSGIFIWSKCSGVRIQKGDILGVIKDPYGTKKIEIVSNYSGQIIGHNNASVVNSGDALYHIGTDEEMVGF